MRFSVAVVLAAAGIVSAQSSSGSTCDAQNIVDSCLATTQIPLDNCAPNDWQCMCDAQTQVVTCYNNCPGDQNRFAAQNQQTSWCNAAAQLRPTSSSTRAPTMATSAATAAASASSSEASSSASASASASAAANAAAGLIAPATGILALAAGFLGFM